MNRIKLQAHKGVASECPENTMSAFRCAAMQGYDVIELDPEYTKDMQIVVLHDKFINRTARLKDGSKIESDVNINTVTLAEARKYDFGIWLSNKYRGEKIPLFADVLSFAEKSGIRLKIDNKIQRFPKEILDIFFNVVKNHQKCISITSNNIEFIHECLNKLPNIHIDYDGIVTKDILEKLSAAVPRERLTVWLPYECENTSWVRKLEIPFADESTAVLVKKYANLGIWILSSYEELDDAALRLKPDIIETDGTIKPMRRKGKRCDMHTHSQNSHDSECTVADMAAAEHERGISAFAVTDHCDIEYCEKTDIDLICRNSLAEATRASRDSDMEILCGIEIGEAFWHKDFAEKIIKKYDFDVVIGSVHAVKFEGLEMPYSKIDFAKLGLETTRKYMKKYFSDMLFMLENCDLDVLAHLTCPLRYINGKYNLGLDCAEFDEQITMILRFITEHKTALEVNTSCLFEGSGYRELLPEKRILKQYREMGGYLITTGSDAHTAANAANAFDEVYDTLKELGFENAYYYKNRCAMQYAIK